MDQREAEALRRRLYAPDATEDDRRRYAVVAPAAQEVRPEPRRRRPRVPVAIVVIAAVLIAGGGAALVGRLARPDVTRPVVARPVAVASPSQRLIGGSATRVAMTVDGVATVGQRIRGEGAAIVPIDTSGASFRGGTVVVELYSADPRPIGWEARRLVTRADWSSYERVVATSAAADRRGAPRPRSAPYTGAPPLWIAVDAPAGAVWTLTVALTSGSGPALH